MGAVALTAAAYWAFGRTPQNYDLEATKICLQKSAVVRDIPRTERRFPAYPGISVRFRGDSTEAVALYFAPSSDEASNTASSDSERPQRQRNVLTEYVADAGWDKRVASCLRAHGSS